MPDSDSTILSRRATLKRMVCGALAAGGLSQETSGQASQAQPQEFKPENDYPFFGSAPPDARCDQE